MSAASHDAAIATLVSVACGLSPKRLAIVLAHHEPEEALDLLRSGGRLHPMCHRGLPAGRLESLRVAAVAASTAEMAEALAAADIRVVRQGAAAYPPVLACDPEAPAVLFVRGDVSALDGRRVGVVGTRHASAAGRATAGELAELLSDAGVAVVSGLARGIDSAAHRGVRSAGGSGRAVAVVGCAPDHPYPKVNADLWEWVARHGLLISEWPPGVGPDAWRFPQRNRILAALSEVVVVVESRERGGSLITARMAVERGIEVMAVPGSPRSRASAGTNQLLVDGAAPLTSVTDVLVMLGLDHRRAGGGVVDSRPRPDESQQAVLDACSAEPANLDMIVTATGLPITDAALAAARLEQAGWLAEAGGWFEPTASRLSG